MPRCGRTAYLALAGTGLAEAAGEVVDFLRALETAGVSTVNDEVKNSYNSINSARGKLFTRSTSCFGVPGAATVGAAAEDVDVDAAESEPLRPRYAAGDASISPSVAVDDIPSLAASRSMVSHRVFIERSSVCNSLSLDASTSKNMTSCLDCFNANEKHRDTRRSQSGNDCTDFCRVW